MPVQLPTDTLALAPEVPHFAHHFEPHPDARHLVVSFTGLATDPTVLRRVWPQHRRLAKLPVHRLFVESQVRPLPEPCVDLPALARFVDAARTEVGAERGCTVCCGSSLGATAALVVGVEAGFGHVIAGAPIVLLGAYVEDDFIPQVVRESVQRSFSIETCAALDAHIPNMIRAAPGPTRINLFTGDLDHFYPEHPKAVAAACAGNPRVELRTSVAPGVAHDSMFRPWARHLETVLLQLVSTGLDS